MNDPIFPDQEEVCPYEILKTDLDEAGQLKVDLILEISASTDRKMFAERIKKGAQTVGVSERTIRRWVNLWLEKGTISFAKSTRSDQGKYRITQEWQDFILKTYRKGNKGGKKMNFAQVTLRVQHEARKIGDPSPPSYRTVVRVLQPIIQKKKKAKKIRTPGWQGSQLVIYDKDGNPIEVFCSNQVWQCDHTKADIFIVDQAGKVLGRPWVTTVVDAYSRCIMGLHIGFDSPSSQIDALALRHAILPKRYSPAFNLMKQWETKFQQVSTDVPALTWWRENAETFPQVARVVRGLLSVPASSAEVERLWSKAGLVMRPHRNRVSTDLLRALVLTKHMYASIE